CWVIRTMFRSFPRPDVFDPPSPTSLISSYPRCWLAITSPVGRSPAWESAAFWPDQHLLHSPARSPPSRTRVLLSRTPDQRPAFFRASRLAARRGSSVLQFIGS